MTAQYGLSPLVHGNPNSCLFPIYFVPKGPKTTRSNNLQALRHVAPATRLRPLGPPCAAACCAACRHHLRPSRRLRPRADPAAGGVCSSAPLQPSQAPVPGPPPLASAPALAAAAAAAAPFPASAPPAAASAAAAPAPAPTASAHPLASAAHQLLCRQHPRATRGQSNGDTLSTHLHLALLYLHISQLPRARKLQHPKCSQQLHTCTLSVFPRLSSNARTSAWPSASPASRPPPHSRTRSFSSPPSRARRISSCVGSTTGQPEVRYGQLRIPHELQRAFSCP